LTETNKKQARNNSRDSNSVTTLSSTDIQSEKEVRRVQDADRKKADTGSNKIITNYKAQVNTLRKNSMAKTHKIEDLEEKLDVLQQKFGLLEKDNSRVRAALLHVRNNPEELVRQVTKKKGQKKTKVKRSPDSSKDNGGLDPAVESAMLSTGKETVKNVYRTFKFINNDKQEKMFLELMLDSLGKPELLILPDDSDERKAEVKQKRQETTDEYGAYWISELNVHRTYVQVSAQNLKIFTLTQKSLHVTPVL
jgi:hypothetical protein